MDYIETQAYGLTGKSLKFFGEHLSKIGKVFKIRGFLAGNTVDEPGTEQWVQFTGWSGRIVVSGFSWGYGGEGPHGLQTAAERAGFPVDIRTIASLPQDKGFEMTLGVKVEIT